MWADMSMMVCLLHLYIVNWVHRVMVHMGLKMVVVVLVPWVVL